MYRALHCIVALAMILATTSAEADTTPPVKKKSPAARKTSVAPVAAKKPATTLQKNVAKKRAATLAANHKRTPAKPAVTWRNRQLQPTQERYKEIQQALAAKGYLQAEQATGNWDQNSADALKQFQATQNIDASGKINSLSLIALGLGPKHEDTLPRPQPPAQPDQRR
jgi:hypothetical protein